MTSNISNISNMKYIEQEICYVCLEKTYSKSPCQCKIPICEECFQIEKNIRDFNCSICKYDFNDENTINEFINPFFDPTISPRRIDGYLQYILEMKQASLLEMEREQYNETRRRRIQTLTNIVKNIFVKTPLIFGFSLMFGNLIFFFKNQYCCQVEINISIFTHGLLCVLFLNVLHDTIYSKCTRVRQPSSFSHFYDTYNQSV